MVNEQFTWLIPHNQLERTRLTWRTRDAETAEKAAEDRPGDSRFARAGGPQDPENKQRELQALLVFGIL
jgi:hypothetical protein